MNIFIIHGSFGSKDGNWFPWLKLKLEEQGHEVFLPQFPVEDYEKFKKLIETDPDVEPKNQSLEAWLAVLRPYHKLISADTVFVGHSIGPAFILRVLERIKIRVKACVFAAGFLDMLPGYPEFNAVNKTFIEPEFNWEKIKENCQEFICVGGDDDPYVPQDALKKLADELGVGLQLIPGGKHLSKGTAKMTEFQLVFDIINQL